MGVMVDMRPTMKTAIDMVSVSPSDGALIPVRFSFYKRPDPPGLKSIQAP
jgi:hypothetical protein